MSWQGFPSRSGTYAIKVYGASDSSNSSWMYIPDKDRWVSLRALDTSDIQFKFEITQSGSSDTFTIRPKFDTSLHMTKSSTEGKYWGYGLTEARSGGATNWRITKSRDGSYSKLAISGTYEVIDCRDDYHNCVHFYRDQDVAAASKQRWVFLPV